MERDYIVESACGESICDIGDYMLFLDASHIVELSVNVCDGDEHSFGVIGRHFCIVDHSGVGVVPETAFVPVFAEAEVVLIGIGKAAEVLQLVDILLKIIASEKLAGKIVELCHVILCSLESGVVPVVQLLEVSDIGNCILETSAAFRESCGHTQYIAVGDRYLVEVVVKGLAGDTSRKCQRSVN